MLKGTLDDFTLPDIFRLLATSSKTGCVEVRRSAGEGKVFFRSGEVYFAESSLTRDPLGQKLVRARLITDGQLRSALDDQAENGKRLGEILVEAGVLSHEQIEGAVRQQMEDAVFDLLRWELGEFIWNPEMEIEAEVPLSVSIENLVMEASRKLEELEVISQKIPNELAIPAMAKTAPEGAAEINITPEEWRILVLVDGNRSVASIAEAVGTDNFSAMRTLYGLANAGLIEVIEVETPPALEEFAAALEEEETQEPPALEAEETQEQPADESPSTDVAEDEAPSEAPAIDAAVAEEMPVEDEVAEEASTDEEVPVSEIPEPERASALAAEASPSSPETEGTAIPERSPEEIFAAELLTDEPVVAPEAESATEEAAVEDDLVTKAELVSEEIETPSDTEASEEIPVVEPVVDRVAAVKELADLFDNDSAGPPYSAGIEYEESSESVRVPNGQPRRVEDDEEITRGLISRLIDGVKGL